MGMNFRRLSCADATGLASAAPPSSRRRGLRQPELPASRPKLGHQTQGELRGSNVAAKLSSAASPRPASRLPQARSSVAVQKPASETPKLGSQAPAPSELLYSRATMPDLDQLSALVPALSLDDILAGKPVPLDLFSGSSDTSEVPGAAAVASADSLGESPDLPTLPPASRQTMTGLRRRALRPWERARSPALAPPAEPPLPPQPQSPQPPPPSPPVMATDTGQTSADLEVDRAASSGEFATASHQPDAAAAAPHHRQAHSSPDGSRGPAVLQAGSGATSAPSAVAADGPAVGDPHHVSRSSPSESPEASTARDSENHGARRVPAHSQRVPVTGRALSLAYAPATAAPNPDAAPARSVAAPVAAPRKHMPATTRSAASTTAAGPADLLPRPVSQQPGKLLADRLTARSTGALPPYASAAAAAAATAAAGTAEPAGSVLGGVTASLAAAAAGQQRLLPRLGLLEFPTAVGDGPLLAAASSPLTSVAATAAQAAEVVVGAEEVEVLVRSTRAPRSVRVHSREWVAATEAVEAAAAAADAVVAGPSGSGSAMEDRPSSTSAHGFGGGAQQSGPLRTGTGTSTSYSRGEAWQRPIDDGKYGQRSRGSQASSSGTAVSGIQPETVSEPHGIVVLHEAPLREALEAATAASFPALPRDQLPDVVDRRTWRLHAAALFPELYDADWHGSLFDFLFELWPEVGRAHVTAGGGGAAAAARRRLLLTSDAEVAEAMAADAAGAAAAEAAAPPPPPPPARLQRATQLLDGAYAFAARCFSSDDFAVRSAVVVSALDCMDDHDVLLEQMATRLPRLMVQRLLVPLAPRFQPPWVVEEWLAAVADAHSGYVPVANVPRRWQELMARLAEAEVVYPGGGRGVVHAVLEFEEQEGQVQRPQAAGRREAATSQQPEEPQQGQVAQPAPRRTHRTRALSQEPLPATATATVQRANESSGISGDGDEEEGTRAGVLQARSSDGGGGGGWGDGGGDARPRQTGRGHGAGQGAAAAESPHAVSTSAGGSTARRRGRRRAGSTSSYGGE